MLSLFFIDEVDKYRHYGENGETSLGLWAQIFEEEYILALNEAQDLFMDESYRQYLNRIAVKDAHAGYFSRDRKGRAIDSTIKRGETSSGDRDAYQLIIMRSKERLLSLREPTRFIFSHSALIAFREGAVKHIYFVAETKGSEQVTQLRTVEQAIIECAIRHFASISDKEVEFGVVKNYETLYNKVMKD